jgi:hypothetical protein
MTSGRIGAGLRRSFVVTGAKGRGPDAGGRVLYVSHAAHGEGGRAAC